VVGVAVYLYHKTAHESCHSLESTPVVSIRSEDNQIVASVGQRLSFLTTQALGFLTYHFGYHYRGFYPYRGPCSASAEVPKNPSRSEERRVGQQRRERGAGYLSIRRTPERDS